jgi:hypothetical protein
VLISCALRGGADAGQVLGAPPEITARLGIDQRPVLLADPAERDWLEAFIWPEDVEGLATLRGAVDLALATGAAPLVAADAVRDTAGLLAGLPGDEPVVVFTATLLSYLGADERSAFVGQLDEVARRRPVAWIFGEAPASPPGPDWKCPPWPGRLASATVSSPSAPASAPRPPRRQPPRPGRPLPPMARPGPPRVRRLRLAPVLAESPPTGPTA